MQAERAHRGAVSDRDAYPHAAAQQYDFHHGKNFRNRLTTRRELAVLTRALRHVSPASALDLPCGAGRFWPAFATAGVPSLLACDVSPGMLSVAESNRLSPSFPQRLFYSSAFDIQLPDESVDFVACMRFYHHLGRPEDRKQVLAELKRVARRYVAVSLWVDGNLGAIRRARKPVADPQAGYGKRTCRSREEAEAEFRTEFEIIRHYDIWPRVSMWRMYLLRKPH